MPTLLGVCSSTPLQSLPFALLVGSSHKNKHQGSRKTALLAQSKDSPICLSRLACLLLCFWRPYTTSLAPAPPQSLPLLEGLSHKIKYPALPAQSKDSFPTPTLAQSDFICYIISSDVWFYICYNILIDLSEENCKNNHVHSLQWPKMCRNSILAM